MNLENLVTAFLVRQSNLHVHLETAWSQQRLVNHIEAISHTDHENVVELLHTVHLGEELVDNGIANARPVILGATLLANRIDFIKDDDVELTIVTARLVLWRVHVYE